jgi:hypothetical protein
LTVKLMKIIGVATILTVSALLAGNALAEGRGSGPVVYVESQGLFYDSIVLADLPPRGRFQLLTMTGPTGLTTLYGPGDVGYLGGRWWVDVNGDNAMDEGDHFFMCPLLGPGRLDP